MLFSEINGRIESIDVFLIKLISCYIQRFSETLEVHDFTFPKEAEGRYNIRVFYKS